MKSNVFITWIIAAMLVSGSLVFGQNNRQTTTRKVKNLGDTGTHEVGHRGTKNVTGGTIPVYRGSSSSSKRKKYANQEVSYRKAKSSSSTKKRKVRGLWDDTDIVHWKTRKNTTGKGKQKTNK